jgi:hypothetical protein
MPLPTELITPLGNAQSVVKIKGFNAQLWLGKDPGNTPLQICLIDLPSAIPDGKIKELWTERHGGRAAPLILGLVLDGKVTLAGPLLHGNDLPLARGLDADQAGRVLKLAKDCPDRNSAVRFLGSAIETTRSETPGLENSGLFADHVLRQVMSADVENTYRREVQSAHEKAKPLLTKSGKDLIKGLGFATKANDARTDILLDADQKEIALAVLLHESERPEAASPALNGQSPITHAITQAEKRNLRWVITVAHDRSIRLYPAVLNVGVGRRGPCETYVQLHTGLLKETDAGLLWMLFSADALLQDKGAVYRLLADSNRFSGNLAEALRERIYVEVMPRLAKGIADARRHPRKDEAYLRDTLQMATHALFRLLFIAYAEDKDLLPFKSSQQYQRNSLKTVATDLLEDLRKEAKWGDTTTYWDKFVILSQAISKGNKSLSVPAYNGVLFSDDEDDSVHGHALSKVKLKDSVFAPALAGLLLTQPEGKDLGPVDFRSLGVREFGTIYEGLLESELSEATEDLVLKSKDGDQIYVSAGKKDEPAVREGEFYLHNKSGARKASGAYFTKEFAVDHLLDLALDKGLDAHLSKLDGMSENDAAEALFDFRIADIAMGSGHFLIFAIDRIERKFRSYLEKRPLPAVRLQLQELREAANKELGEMAVSVENKLEDAALLRRLIARRCIYGVDMNPISVQLAQLAVWIHTFVPGLPLSFLEHNLIQGNSLVGVANQRDFEDLLDDARLSVKGYLDDALPDIRKMGAIADKNVADVKEMKKLRTAALKKLEPAFAAMDIAVWNRASGKIAGKDADDIMGLLQDPERLLRSNALRDARKGLAPIGSRHLIACFPEVFLRKNPGFDVLLGNPPWEKVKFEKSMFFGRHIPGYYGMAQADRGKAEKSLERSMPNMKQLLEEAQAEAETASTALGNLYSDQKGKHRFGVAAGDPDLFRMFAWRFWELLSQGGRIGIVLPRSAFSGDGLVEWRTQLLGAARGTEENAAEVAITSVVNTGGWVFDDIHQQYTVSLCAIHKNKAKNELLLNGPFNCIADFNKARLKYARFPAAEVLNWTESAKLPLLPSAKAQDAFRKIRQSPNLVGEYDINSSWHCRGYAELHATGDKDLYDLSGKKPEGDPMPVFKGESFDLWEPDRGAERYYGWTKSRQETIDELYRKRKSSFRRGANSPWWGAEDSFIHDKTTIECLHPRIAFRDITRATDSRTTRLALLPPEVVCVHNAPVLVFPKGSQSDVAYVLGILSSRICDWYSRRWVEVHLTFSIFNCLPCPRVPSTHPLYKELVAAAGRLASPDKRFAKWAKSVGVDCGAVKPEEKQALIDRVDAACALLYGLNEAELQTVFETFHEGWEWKPDHARVLAEYTALKKKHKL